MTSRHRPRLAFAVAAAIASSAVAQADPAGWSLNWADEFDGAALNTTRWENLNRRDSFNNEKQHYTPGQVSVTGGNLRITASNVPLNGKAYRSGLVRTYGEQTFGRWEVRASLPSTQGMWPAIWLLPRYADWPTGGEIDIMENRGSQPNLVGSAYHFGSSVAAHQYVARDFSYGANGAPVSFHGSMHDYAVEWDASRIRYLVDGVPHYTIYRAANRPISSTPMSLILNLAVGGDYGGDPNASTVFPQRFDVAHVRVYGANAATRAINNGSFETAAGELFTDWNEDSNGGGNVRRDSVVANARTGTGAAQLYGRFNGSSGNTSSLYQEVPTTAGEVWQVGAWARNRPGDVLAGDNEARLRVDFINANGTVIGTGQLGVVDADAPTAYREAVLRRVAPAGAAFARAVLEFRQVGSATGAANFDDASLRRWTEASSLAGDVNLDGVRDAADLDALLHSLTADNAAFDYDGVGGVNGADVDALLASAFGTVRGDADLDGRVDFADLVTLAQNYGSVGTGTWTLGDFTGDSSVAFADLVALAQAYGTTAPPPASASADFAGDWALARSLVPEPASVALLAVAVALAGSRRRQRLVSTTHP